MHLHQTEFNTNIFNILNIAVVPNSVLAQIRQDIHHSGYPASFKNITHNAG